MIRYRVRGNWKKTRSFLEKSKKYSPRILLESIGKRGVEVLSRATPIDTGLTAHLWTYEINQRGNYFQLSWSNGNVVDGIPVVILLQYGHGTGTGGYVKGMDFINPSIRPIFDSFSKELDREIERL